jgi:hypothetical protein
MKPTTNHYHTIEELMTRAKEHDVTETLGYVLSEAMLNHDAPSHPTQLLPYISSKIEAYTHKILRAYPYGAHTTYDESSPVHDITKLRVLKSLCDITPPIRQE